MIGSKSSPPATERRHSPADVHLPGHGVCVIESHHAESFHMETGVWPFHKLCRVAMGRGQIEMPDGDQAIQRDDFLLLPAGLEHRFVDSLADPLSLVIVCMDAQFLAPGGWRESVWQETIAMHSIGLPRRARSAFQQSELLAPLHLLLQEQTRQAPGWELAILSAAGELLVRMMRSCVPAGDIENRNARSVEGVIEFLDSHFHQQVQVPDLAGRCGMSVRRFSNLFKQRTGQTLTRYLNERRINYAKDRLRKTGHILYSCYESGFHDVGYFYRVFKKHTGLTPGQFMRDSRQRKEVAR